MPVDKGAIQTALAKVGLADGGDLVSRDMIRALQIGDSGDVKFVIEADDAAAASRMEPILEAAKAAVLAVEGVSSVSALLTAHSGGPAKPAAPAPQGGTQAPPSLKIGRHPTPQAGPTKIAGVERIIAVGSGKGGVGKSTVSANLAVALARQGRKVGLLDADIYGPSQPRMMGLNKRPGSPDGERIVPLHAHGVTFMSIGLMLEEGQAVIWRGPMLMGALQQMMTQVEWGELDVLIVDLPPGTGDVQLTLCQRYPITGAVVVSTPQDVALIDARKAIDMFGKLKTPVLGLIENMSTYICPNCGHEAHLFGHGGVAAEAKLMNVPLLAQLPLELDTRLGGDKGVPVAAGEGSAAEAYAALAKGLVEGGMG
ncbi:Mrp/NBP35 family ATP-binding protein [Oceanicola sp. 502str15]|uniref:Mrp/NBP35 family ATP-binding protein n=1 Tax=Oceanicola sp. 502str15 TaxID=2696061 RepID=UPI0020944941|nr:Mrp/NBP35 family ATP-binding protein [Oceanicola sp. 502str15]MCO6381424.1 P-loop NTPase [Oceanicola sp. 502str15]